MKIVSTRSASAPVAFVFLSAYLFCCLTVLLVMPRRSSSASSQNLHAYHSSKYYLQNNHPFKRVTAVTDKVINDDNKVILPLVAVLTSGFLFVVVAVVRWSVLLPFSLHLSYSKQHAYLILSCLRI